MIQLNLLPDVKKEFLRAQSARRKTIAISILVTIIAAGLTAVVAIYVYAVQNGIKYLQTEDIKSKSSELSSVKDIDKYLTIQNQLAQLSSLHGNKNNFSRLIDFLPRLNPAPPQNIVLSNLDVDTTNTTINFKGRVSDYGALTTFKDTLTNATFTHMHNGENVEATKLFSKVTIDSALYEKTSTSSGVTFAITVVYDSAVFKQENTNVVVTVPNKETTGSVVGSPAIFGGNQ
ncbi:hypothetical protein EYC58_00510 [Candidatus Saccharibacteria bacterium]|nr:MAG: hypothetical protein EYC58_00510 [Candidatus Saccharibacteria bacterium]